MVTTEPPVFSVPRTSSSTISPTKKGVACTHTHTHTESWFSTVTNCENTTVSSPLLLLAVVSSSSICLGRRAESLQDFHVCWSVLFVSASAAGATALKLHAYWQVGHHKHLSALEVQVISLAEINISASIKTTHAFIFRVVRWRPSKMKQGRRDINLNVYSSWCSLII